MYSNDNSPSFPTLSSSSSSRSAIAVVMGLREAANFPPIFECFCIPIFEIVLNTFGCCYALLLLRIIRATQLHRNCRYLLSAWTIGYFGQFFANASIGVLNLTIGHQARNLVDPIERFYLINMSPGLQMFCIFHEIAIASERIFSSFRPERYYYSSWTNKLMILSTLICILSAAQTVLVNEGYQVIVNVFILLLDISTLIVNAIAVRYCRTRYLKNYGIAPLNARYQVKESLELASAMQPAYVVTFIGKKIVNFVATSTCFTFDSDYNCIPLIVSVPWPYIEALFCAGQTICSLFLLSWLSFNHPRLHRNLLILWGIQVPNSHRVIDVSSITPQSDKEESDVYFGMLNIAWS